MGSANTGTGKATAAISDVVEQPRIVLADSGALSSRAASQPGRAGWTPAEAAPRVPESAGMLEAASVGVKPALAMPLALNAVQHPRIEHLRELLRAFNHSPRAVVLFYVALLSGAELVTFLGTPAAGIAFYSGVLIALIAHASLLWEQPVHKVLLSLTFAPIIRLVSLAVPLGSFSLIQAYVITGVPLIISAVVSIRSMKLSAREVGLGLGRRPLLQVVIIPTGLVLGVAEYLVLRPEPMVVSSSWQDFVLPALVLLVCTGFVEELMFRGIMQSTMRPILGTASIVTVSVLFAVMHIGYRSPMDVFIVLVAGLMFGIVAYSSRSIWGVTLAHGLTNVVLFLICPLIMPGLGL